MTEENKEGTEMEVSQNGQESEPEISHESVPPSLPVGSTVEQSPVPPASSTASLPVWSQARVHSLKWALSGLVILGVVLVVSIVYFTPAKKHVEQPKSFTNVYTFVPEKISKSAFIPIRLPEGVTEEEAKTAITFDPEISGEFVQEDIPNVLLFEPKQELTESVYYAVNLNTDRAKIRGDFYVDNDPSISTIFPNEGTEANEDSDITIVFNRPMVPLTTLSETENLEIPISITPPTKGRFKWISTRTLQFTPETTLLPSSAYTVEVKEGFVSIDGIAVSPRTHQFVTRPLRYESSSEGSVGYRSPLILSFNQPVSLDKTKNKIIVAGPEGEVSVDVTYGEKKYFDWEKNTIIIEEDQSKLYVYQKKDTHGRKHFWDFNTSYTATIEGAETEGGTMPLAGSHTVSFSVPGIIEYIEAKSDRSEQVRPDFFDPQGELILHFYEDIDKEKIDLKVKGLKSMSYGERCRKDEKGNNIESGYECEKEPDRTILILTFESNAFAVGESFDLTLRTVFAADGTKIFDGERKETLTVYRTFSIEKTSYDSQITSTDLDGVLVCTTVPLKNLEDDETLKKYVETSGYIVYGRLDWSRYIDASWGAQYTGPCTFGQFETKLNFGLLPSTKYTITFDLADTFGQTAKKEITITTKAPGSVYTRFHNLQKAYQVTKPGRTKFTYAVENLETVNLHICKMPAEKFLERTSAQYGRSEAPNNNECQQIVRDTIQLPKTYWVNNYFQIDLGSYFTDTRGQYVITFMSPLYIDEYSKEQLYDRTMVNVTNLAVGKKEVERSDQNWSARSNPSTKNALDKSLSQTQNLYWVTHSETLQGLSNVSVTQYAARHDEYVPRLVGAGVTDGQGIARIDSRDNVMGAIVRNGQDTAVISDWADQLNYAWQAESAARTYVYTDRPIYRPSQTVYIRGIDRVGYDGTYEVVQNDPAPLVVYNARDEKVYETLLTVSEYGTFHSSFEIPTDAPLGSYRIEALGQSSWISVEEYVPAAFKLETKTLKDEYITGDTIDLDVQADYYFGVPLDGGEVSYSVTSQDYYFDRYRDEYFNFGGNWYTCYYCGYGDHYLFRGEARLDEHGHARISKSIVLSEYFKDDELGSKLITFSITVKDKSGRSVSSQRSFVLHKGKYYLGVRTDDYYASVQNPVTLRIKSVDLEGKPIAVSDVERAVYKVEWETFKRQEVDGGFYYRSEQKQTLISKETVKTDRDGNWVGTLNLETSGQYKIVVTGRDSKGNIIETETSIYLYGDDAVYVPPNNSYELDLEVEKTNLSVGDIGSILIKSPYKYAKVLIAAERGSILDYWIVEVTGGLYKHSFPVREAYAPNVSISVLLLSSDPEVKFGSHNFRIDTDTHKLNVEVTSDKKEYLPGEEVTLQVKTTDAKGIGTKAEVALAVADLSVLALRGNPKKDPLAFFYDGFPLSVVTGSNMKNILYEVDIPLGSKGGGGAPDDLAAKKRGVFKDTAYWNATFTTSDSGEGKITFTLPDNLTTWQVESLGVTKDTKLGVGYTEFTTKKDLMVVPLKPRFSIPGDTFSIGAQVFNQTGKDVTMTLSIESPTLVVSDKEARTIKVKSGESGIRYFPVEAPKNIREGVHTFTLTAKTDSHVDSVSQDISITKSTVYETVAAASITKEDEATEYIYIPKEVVTDEGGLTIHANATLAIFMGDALTYMAQYPYGCSEQIASALSTIAMITEALDVPGVAGNLTEIKDEYGIPRTVKDVVNAGLARIYESQDFTGGFSYYKGLEANVSLTIRIVEALTALKDAGYTVREDAYENARAFLSRSVVQNYNTLTGSRDEVILGGYALVFSNYALTPEHEELLRSFAEDDAFVNEKANNMSLAYFAMLAKKADGTLPEKKLYKALMNRISLDGRGAYLKTPETAERGYFETPISNTALLIRVMVSFEDVDIDVTANALRTIIASRDRDGVWGSTQNTFGVVTALVQYLTYTKETERSFTLKGFLKGVELFVKKYTPESAMETVAHEVPMVDLPKGEMLPLTFTQSEQTGERGNIYYDLALKYYLPAANVPPRDEGITINRALYALTDTQGEVPLQEARVGEIVRGRITITIPEAYTDIAIADFIPAGFEIVNFNLATEDQTLDDGEESDDMYYEYEEYGYGEQDTSLAGRVLQGISSLWSDTQTAQLSWWNNTSVSATAKKSQKIRPTFTESHDDRVFLYKDTLAPGIYTYDYYLRALIPGTFQHLPAHAEELYFPEIFGRTDGQNFTVLEAE